MVRNPMLVGGFFPPIWKISVKLGIFPKVKIKSFWNHHLVWYEVNNHLKQIQEKHRPSEKWRKKIPWLFHLRYGETVKVDTSRRNICICIIYVSWLYVNMYMYPELWPISFKWMFGETTIFHVIIWSHPTETTNKNWLFGVPGICLLSRYEYVSTWMINQIFTTISIHKRVV